jgi:hypothetical protein
MHRPTNLFIPMGVLMHFGFYMLDARPRQRINIGFLTSITLICVQYEKELF